MKAEFEIVFASPESARKALRVIRTKEISGKVKVSLSVEKNVLNARIEAKGFAPLRARITSMLRDLKVVFDAISIVEKGKKNKNKNKR